MPPYPGSSLTAPFTLRDKVLELSLPLGQHVLHPYLDRAQALLRLVFAVRPLVLDITTPAVASQLFQRYLVHRKLAPEPHGVFVCEKPRVPAALVPQLMLFGFDLVRLFGHVYASP